MKKLDRKAPKGAVKLTIHARWGCWRWGTRYLYLRRDRAIGSVRRYSNPEHTPSPYFTAHAQGRTDGKKYGNEMAARDGVVRLICS